jgi:hypothetical protein
MNKDVKINNENVVEIIETELTELTEMVKSLEIVMQSEQFEGPIPHPEHMKLYKNIDTTFPNRILKMAEKNLDHKQSMEKITTFGELFIGFLGWSTPTSISFYVLYNAIQFINDGKSIEAFIALVTAITTLVGAFYMKNRNKDN